MATLRSPINRSFRNAHALRGARDNVSVAVHDNACEHELEDPSYLLLRSIATARYAELRFLVDTDSDSFIVEFVLASKKLRILQHIAVDEGQAVPKIIGGIETPELLLQSIEPEDELRRSGIRDIDRSVSEKCRRFHKRTPPTAVHARRDSERNSHEAVAHAVYFIGAAALRPSSFEGNLNRQ